jgi:hypothetical protein
MAQNLYFTVGNAVVIVQVVTELPTPTEGLRGRLVLLNGGTGVSDMLYICIKNDVDAYVWFDLTNISSVGF